MTSRFYRFGLIGYPLSHSRSPELHHAALAAEGLLGEYRLFTIAPGQDMGVRIRDLIDQVRSQQIHGLNVTIPHKQNVIAYMDQLTEIARAVGAVNTIYLAEDGRLVGDNTDTPGFMQDVKRVTEDQQGNALVLGAGGSARAVVYGLAVAGWQVSILSRREEQAADLAHEIERGSHLENGISCGKLTPDNLARLAKKSTLVVNCTPVGMYPHADECPWPEELPLPPNAAVYDLVYNPIETKLVQRAQAAGLQASCGSGMLVAQAALAFSRWTGLEPPFDAMGRAFRNTQIQERGEESL